MSHEQDLSVACLTGDVAVVDRLLQVPGVDATGVDNYAIRMAARYGHLAVVDRLLQVPGVDVSARDNEAFRIAAMNGDVQVVERLLREECVVIKLGLAPQVVRDSSTRCAVAITQCVAAKKQFRKDVVAAFRLAYECVRNELYHDMGGQLCEWVWPYPVARQAIEVQRALAVALRRLRR
eukprot:TRINITY_DN759_c0_g1_i9.p1 TRINITY_DN759_c0_g1~~TRINITY_DN759_c0_g1_i9.p1  ORF type:complete len:179 (+),score=25.97 TRINITY_DN759_c0_g1_i9:57-593(+)